MGKILIQRPLVRAGNIILVLFVCLTPLYLNTSLVWAQETAVESDDFALDDEWDIDEEPLAVYDPLEKYNRTMFKINDTIYRKLFNPISEVYDFLIPKFLQKRINNVSRLASTPKRFLNNMFQKKYKAGLTELSRLVINASVGAAGIFDPADHFLDMEQQTEDTNRTLAHYGMGKGAYLIVPILGPTTARGFLGGLVDHAMSPFFWFGIYDVESESAFLAFGITKRINSYTYRLREPYEEITEPALDPYIAVQNAYIQNADKRVSDSPELMELNSP